MELYLLRHGIAVDGFEWSGSDHDRPLTDAGRLQLEDLLPLYRDRHGVQIDSIWSSPLIRCGQTAEIAARHLGAAVTQVDALASGADLLRSLPAWVTRRTKSEAAGWPERLLCVGHQPDLGVLVCQLTGAGHGRYGLGRAGAAALSGEFRKGGMRLLWLLGADEVLAAGRDPA